ncbi:MAG: hypothetical protein Q9159_000983 [Coniocarpon cinnabarinum]
MPPKKRTADYDTSDPFIEDDASPPSKRSKTKASSFKTASNVSANGASAGTDEDGNPFWTLNEKGTRRVTINEFKGMWMVNVREMYEKDGKMLPGKKGISMTLEQYNAFVGAMPGVEQALRSKGQEVLRPQYDGSNDATDKGGDDDVEHDEEDASEEE